MKKKLLFLFIIIFIIALILFPKTVQADTKADYMIVGDSRTLNTYDAYTGNSTVNPINKTIVINGKNVRMLAVSGVGYDYWFGNNSHYSQITSALAELKTGGNCFIWLGINGNISDSYATKYANSLNSLAKNNPNKNIYFCSVTGIYKQTYDKYYRYAINNNDINNFNNKVKTLINSKSLSNLKFKDVSNTNVKIGSETKTVNNFIINSNKYATDGLHYLGENRILYKAIWEQAMTNSNNSTLNTTNSQGIINNSGQNNKKNRYSISMNGINEEREEVEFTDVLTNKDYYTDVGDLNEESKTEVEKAAGNILGVITNIGIVLSILMPALIGIKYMISGKMEAKKDMVPYFIGATILFSICIIVKIIMIMAEGINSI